jgi:hypothetical protein
MWLIFTKPVHPGARMCPDATVPQLGAPSTGVLMFMSAVIAVAAVLDILPPANR